MRPKQNSSGKKQDTFSLTPVRHEGMVSPKMSQLNRSRLNSYFCNEPLLEDSRHSESRDSESAFLSVAEQRQLSENGKRASRRFSNTNGGSRSGAARRKSSCNKTDGKKYQPFPDKEDLTFYVKQREFNRRGYHRKKLVYDFFDKPTNRIRWLYHFPLFLLFLACLILHIFNHTPDEGPSRVTKCPDKCSLTGDSRYPSMLLSNGSYNKTFYPPQTHGEYLLSLSLFIIELFIVIIISIEFTLRVWSAGCRSRYQGWIGRFRFCTHFFCVLDLIIVISSIVIFIISYKDRNPLSGAQSSEDRSAMQEEVNSRSSHLVFGPTAIRMLRFLVVLRMMRVDRRGGSWKLLSSVVKAHFKELITTWYIGWLMLLLCSFLVYQCERGHVRPDGKDNQFQTLADAIWWGLVTLTTIGYGDMVPQTPLGKFIAGFFANFTVAFFALPAGILGTGFALKVQEQNRMKHFARRRVPAAILIQCAWRCYASDPDNEFTDTWKFKNGKKSGKSGGNGGVMVNSVTSPAISGVQGKGSREFTNNTSTNQNTVQSSVDGPGLSLSQTFNFKGLSFKANSDRWKHIVKKAQEDNKVDTVTKELGFQKAQQEEEDEWDISASQRLFEGPLEEKEKNAIRFVRYVKYLVARRKFKEALQPFDVKDIMDQYSAGNIDMLSRLKFVQDRINNLPTVIKKAAEDQQKQLENDRKARVAAQDNNNPNKSIISLKSSTSARNSIFEVVKQAAQAKKEKEQKMQKLAEETDDPGVNNQSQTEQTNTDININSSSLINSSSHTNLITKSQETERMTRLESRLDRFESLLERLVDKIDASVMKKADIVEIDTDKKQSYPLTTEGEHNQVLSASSATTDSQVTNATTSTNAPYINETATD